MLEQKKYSIIPIALSSKELYELVKKVVKKEDFAISVHNHFEESLGDEDRYKGTIYLHDISAESYATDKMDRMINFDSFESDETYDLNESFNQIYDGPKTILTMGEDSFSTNLLGAIVRYTGGYDISNLERTEYTRHPLTSIIPIGNKLIEAESFLNKEVDLLISNNPDLFLNTEQNKLKETLIHTLMSHIDLKPKKHHNIPEI